MISPNIKDKINISSTKTLDNSSRERKTTNISNKKIENVNSNLKFFNSWERKTANISKKRIENVNSNLTYFNSRERITTNINNRVEKEIGKSNLEYLTLKDSMEKSIGHKNELNSFGTINLINYPKTIIINQTNNNFTKERKKR